MSYMDLLGIFCLIQVLRTIILKPTAWYDLLYPVAWLYLASLCIPNLAEYFR